MNWDRKRGRSAAILAVALLACAVPQVASAESVPLPGGAGTGNVFDNYLSGMSCPSAGNCVATGSYADSAGNVQGMIETESSGTWTSQELNLSSLPSVSSNPTAQPSQLSCPAAGNCVAVGNYEDANNHGQGLIVTQTGGGWAVSRLPLAGLSNAYSDPGIDLNSLSCPSVGNCVAVGSYTDTSHHSQALIATDNAGTWTTQEADLAALSPYSDPRASLAHVSCASAGNCVAVGGFTDSADQPVSMIETETDGIWVASRPDVSNLSDLSSTGRNVIWGVSCQSAGDCSAVGYYLDDSSGGGTDQPMVLAETGGSWAPAAEPQLPGDANATTASAHLYGLSCASAGNCTAIGDYRDTSNDLEAFTLTETGGSWAVGSELSPPSDAAANPRTYLSSIACTAPGNCLVGGTYYATGTNNEMLVARLTAGNWSTAGIVQPTTAGAYPVNYTSTACTATGDYCAVGGSSLDWGTDNEVAFLVNGPGAATVAAAAITGTTAQVSWTAPGDDGGLPITGYTVTTSDLTSAGRGGQSVAVGAVSSATVPGLTAGDTYTFTITPASLLGSGLPATTPSATVPVSTQPPAPVSIQPPISTRQLAASLAGLLAPHGAASRLSRIGKAHGYTFTWTPLEAGRVTINWYAKTGKRRHRKSRLIATGAATATGTAAIRIKVKLNRRGERLVKLGKRFRVTAKVRFVSGKTSVSVTHVFTLH